MHICIYTCPGTESEDDAALTLQISLAGFFGLSFSLTSSSLWSPHTHTHTLLDLVGALFLSCLGPLQGKKGRVALRGRKCWSCAWGGIKGPSDLVFGGSEVGAKGL